MLRTAPFLPIVWLRIFLDGFVAVGRSIGTGELVQAGLGVGSQ